MDPNETLDQGILKNLLKTCKWIYSLGSGGLNLYFFF